MFAMPKPPKKRRRMTYAEKKRIHDEMVSGKYQGASLSEIAQLEGAGRSTIRNLDKKWASIANVLGNEARNSTLKAIRQKKLYQNPRNPCDDGLKRKTSKKQNPSDHQTEKVIKSFREEDLFTEENLDSEGDNNDEAERQIETSSTIEETELSLNWCRGCGNSRIVELNQQVAEIVGDLIQISYNEVALCRECCSLVDKILKFKKKAEKLSSMFDELNEIGERKLNIPSINDVRDEFGLKGVTKDDILIKKISNNKISIDYSDNTQHWYSGEADFDIVDRDLIQNIKKVVQDEVEKSQISAELLNISPDYDETFFILNCRLCKATFRTYRHLKIHCLDDHDAKPNIRCFSCKKIIRNKKLLTVHRRIHAPCEDDPTFSCNYCESKFATEKGLKKHMSYHEETWNEDLKTICETCGQEFSAKNFKNHVKFQHANLVEMQMFMLTCDLCGKLLKSKCFLEEHMARKHLKLKHISCHQCEKRFTTFKDCEKHIETHRTEPFLFCDICGEGFNRTLRLRSHRKTHFDKPFKCQICLEEFYVKYKFKLHMVRHTGAKNFECHLCANAYVTKAGLVKHLAVHTGFKRFGCIWCSYRCIDRGNLVKHARSSHVAEFQDYQKVHGKANPIRIFK